MVEHFVEKHSKKGVGKMQVDDSAMRKLMEYSYPGNIRELENIVFSSISLVNDDEIITDKLIRLPMEFSDLAVKNEYDSSKMSMSDYIDAIEQKIIRDKLLEFNGNISKAADDLQLKRQTLQHKIKKFDIKPPKKLH